MSILEMMAHRQGDKVRIKHGQSLGVRGIIVEISGDRCQIDPSTGGGVIDVSTGDLVNYSAAARKAWKKMPERKVGRPTGSVRTDRVSVTFRIDRVLWESFLDTESKGVLPERNALIDGMVEKCLKDAKSKQMNRGDL